MYIYFFKGHGLYNIICSVDFSILKDFQIKIFKPEHPYHYIRLCKYLYIMLGLIRSYGNLKMIQLSYAFEYLFLMNETFYHEYIEIDEGIYAMNAAFLMACISLYSLV